MKPGKQRKRIEELPKNKRRKQVSARLSKELSSKYKRRNFPLRKGDKVKILRGKHKNKEAKVQKISLKDYKAFLEGITIKKKDGTEKPLPISPSNLQIIELDLSDKKRVEALERKIKG